MSWKEKASCKNKGLDLWFSRRSSEEGQSAISICNMCPVKKECLNYIMNLETSDGLRIGIWGGLGPYERAELNKD